MRVYISSKLPLSITILDRGQVPFRGRNNNRPFSLHPASPQDTARVNQQKTAIFFFNTLQVSGWDGCDLPPIWLMIRLRIILPSYIGD